MIDLIRHYPVLVTAAVEAVIALVVAFGLDLTAEQVGAIVAVMSALLGLVTTTQTNSRAYVEEITPETEGMV